jgi:hypothetical protein
MTASFFIMLIRNYSRFDVLFMLINLVCLGAPQLFS